MKELQPLEIPLSGINLVEASAGTGKTYCIASLYIRAIVEGRCTVDQILVVTYTEAATKELRDRLMRRLRESLRVLQTQSPAADDPFLCELLEWSRDYESAVQNLERAIRNFDEAAISTIHGFCYNVLSDRAFLSNSIYDMEMIGDDSELIQEAVDDFWRKWIAESSADFKKKTLAEFIISRGYNPQHLADQLTTAIGKPYLNWVPKENLTPELEKNIGRLKDQFAELQEVWKKDSTEIQQLLFHDGLNGNKYRKTSIPGWIRHMQEMLEGEIPPIDLFDKFEKFTSACIEDSLTKEGDKNPPQHPFFNLCDEYQSIAEHLKNYETTFKKKVLEYLTREVPRKKRDKEVLSYDDMLINLQQALRHEETGDKLKKVLRRQYPLALVDEFQDTDPVQYDIFRSIYGGEEGQRGLFMIGDPKQSIYSFRGADVFAYLSARRDADNDRVYGLNHNFRSVPLLIEAVNNVFQTGNNPFVFENIHFEPSKPGRKEQDYTLFTENNRPVRPMVLQYWPADRQKRLNKDKASDYAAAVTAAEIYRLINNGEAGTCKIGDKNLRASDMAVLVRKHHEADLMRNALEEYDIKSVQFSQESVFASDEAEQLEIILQAVAEPSREVSVRAALASPLMDRTAAYIDACNSDEELWLQELNRFSSLQRAWNTHGFAYMFRTLLYDEKVAEHVIRQPRGERILTNLIHLGELIQQKENEEEGGIRNTLKWLAKKRQDDSSQKDEEQIRLESDERLVKIVTMHKSKGLQYPVVFCPFLWSGPNLKEDGKPLVFHKPEENYQAFIDLQAKDSNTRSYHRYLAEREELAESMRLAYVALTRAEHRCYISWFPAGSSLYSPLGCLMAGSERVLDALKEKTGYGKSSSSITLERVEKKLKAVAERSPELFDLQEIEPGPGTGEKSRLQSSDSTTGLHHRTVSRQGPLPLKNHIASFSSLTRYKVQAEDPLYFDELFERSEPAEETEETPFAFPRGPGPGTCIHKIFEEIDFQDPESIGPVTERNLELYGIHKKWKEVGEEMVLRVLQTPFPANNIRLADISDADRLDELEFYYPTGALKTNELLQIIREGRTDAEIDITAPSGFVKGFIDLTFRSNGRYYIADYKTNHLGNQYSDYTPDRLKAEMAGAYYDLQYHIYTVALHRLLSKRVPGYRYKQHFGGIYYLFVRGMHPKEERTGIFMHRPAYAVIEKLNQRIGGI